MFVVAGLARRTVVNDVTDDVSAGAPGVSPLPSAGGGACGQASGFQSLSATSGYLAAVNTDTASGSNCPWLITARPGQRITVVAYDFAWPPAAADPSTAPADDPRGSSRGWPDLTAGHPACPMFATLEERGTMSGGRAVRLCEVRHRRTVVYSSLGHELVIRLKAPDLNHTSARTQRLFLHYEGMHLGRTEVYDKHDKKLWHGFYFLEHL